MANLNCPKCKGSGFVKEKDGSIHTCFDCLLDGNMDQHNANLKDAGIKV
jgi:hypothetical protein